MKNWKAIIEVGKVTGNWNTPLEELVKYTIMESKLYDPGFQVHFKFPT